MCIMAVSIILFVLKYQRDFLKLNEEKGKELIYASIQSAEEERMRIASELHDDVGVTLVSARLFLHNTETINLNHETIKMAKDLLEDSISKIRRISHHLQPLSLPYIGLQASLRSFIETLSRSKAFNTDFIIESDLPELEDKTALMVYRIVQELINNIIKHSRALNISLKISSADPFLIIEIDHNGSGLTQDEFETMTYKTGATGLKNIVNRSKLISAEISFSKENENYNTKITVPINTTL